MNHGIGHEERISLLLQYGFYNDSYIVTSNLYNLEELIFFQPQGAPAVEAQGLKSVGHNYKLLIR